MNPEPSHTVTVCVGSSCHVKGARDMIARFQSLVRQHGAEDRVFLKGSFCMKRCGSGMNWMIDDRPVTSASIAEALAVFERDVLETLNTTPRAGSDREGDT